jgi:hypothetical protein
MRAWGAALWRESWPAFIGAFSLASTVLTFFPNLGLYRFRWVSLVCLIGAFAWANLRVFTKQQTLIQDLQSRVVDSASGVRRAQLFVHHRDYARYIVVVPSSGGVASQIYIELGLALENKGNRTSNIIRFDVHIRGALSSFQNLKPEYPKSVQGRTSVQSLSGTGLGMEGHITIPQEEMISGRIAFFVPFIPSRGFTGSGRTFDPIECTLTVTDTEGVTASRHFRVTET